MKANLLTAALSTILATGLPAFAQTATYHIDPAHSEIGFSIRHMAISTVHGRFGIKTGTIVFDAKDVTKSSVEGVIDVSSVDTGTAKRDADLKTAQFFDMPGASMPVYTRVDSRTRSVCPPPTTIEPQSLRSSSRSEEKKICNPSQESLQQIIRFSSPL